MRALAGGRWSGGEPGRGRVAWTVATVYGATDEWHQSFMPGRKAELRDLADERGRGGRGRARGAWGIIRRSWRA